MQAVDCRTSSVAHALKLTDALLPSWHMVISSEPRASHTDHNIRSKVNILVAVLNACRTQGCECLINKTWRQLVDEVHKVCLVSSSIESI